jgi:hypothetical protein
MPLETEKKRGFKVKIGWFHPIRGSVERRNSGLFTSEMLRTWAKERMEAIAGIKRGIEAMQSAKGKSADKFFVEFFAEHRIADD